MSENLFTLFRQCFRSDPKAVFIEEADGSTLSYGELAEWTGRLANVLQNIGVGPGDRVALQVDKSQWALLVYLATLRVGAVHLPLNPAYTTGELRYFLTDAEPVLLLCAPERLETMRALAAETGVPRVETLGSRGEGSLTDAARSATTGFHDVPRTSDDLAAILYTSGTTGRSKGAMLSHGNLFSNAETLREAWRFRSDDRLLHALPIFHTHGLFVATHLVLLTGASMILLPAFDGDAIIRLLPRASVMMGVPTFYTRLLAREDFGRGLVEDVRLFISGSAPLSAETHKEFEARTGHAILERYGMTETNMNTSNPYDGPRVAGTVGPPLPGVEIRIADPVSGEPLPQGQVGMIEIRGPNVFQGYWRMPDRTAAEFRADGFFISGDLGSIDEAGYVRIIGRAKDLIISGGLNVYPAEVEAAIEEVPGVAECAIIGVPHPDLGEAVVALVIARPGARLEEAEIHGALADRLARYKQPRRLFVVDQLPRNAMGKIRKNMLRDDYSATFAD